MSLNNIRDDLRMSKSHVERWPAVAAHREASAWLRIQSDLGLAPRTLDAYDRALEAKANLQRMLVEIPLSDEERAAVEDGQLAVDRLLDRLSECPLRRPDPRPDSWRARRSSSPLPVIQPPTKRSPA